MSSNDFLNVDQGFTVASAPRVVGSITVRILAVPVVAASVVGGDVHFPPTGLWCIEGVPSDSRLGELFTVRRSFYDGEQDITARWVRSEVLRRLETGDWMRGEEYEPSVGSSRSI